MGNTQTDRRTTDRDDSSPRVNSTLRKSLAVRLPQTISPSSSGSKQPDSFSPGLDKVDDGGPHPITRQDNIEYSQIEISNTDDKKDGNALNSIPDFSQSSLQESCSIEGTTDQQYGAEEDGFSPGLDKVDDGGPHSVTRQDNIEYSQIEISNSDDKKDENALNSIREFSHCSLHESCSIEGTKDQQDGAEEDGFSPGLDKVDDGGQHPVTRQDNIEYSQIEISNTDDKKDGNALNSIKEFSHFSFHESCSIEGTTDQQDGAEEDGFSPGLDKVDDGGPHPVTRQDNIEYSQIPKVSSKEDNQNESAFRNIQMSSHIIFNEQENVTKMRNNSKNEKEPVQIRCRRGSTPHRSQSFREPQSSVSSFPSPMKESLGFRPRFDAAGYKCENTEDEQDEKVNACSAKVAYSFRYPGISEGTPDSKIVKPMSSPHSQRRCENSNGNRGLLVVCPTREQNEKTKTYLQQSAYKSSNTTVDVAPNKDSDMDKNDKSSSKYHSYSDKPALEEGSPQLYSDTYVCERRHVLTEKKPTKKQSPDLESTCRWSLPVSKPVVEEDLLNAYISAGRYSVKQNKSAMMTTYELESIATSRGYIPVGRPGFGEASSCAYAATRKPFISQKKQTKMTTSDLESTTTSRGPLAVKRTQKIGLRGSMTIQDKSTTRVSNSFNTNMAQISERRDHQTFSSKPMISPESLPRRKTFTRRLCLDSDYHVSSRRSRAVDVTASLPQRKSNLATMMQVPQNSIGVWKFGEDKFFTTVPKVWSVSDCIAHVRNKIGRFGYGDLDLWIKNRCIMLDKMKSLSDYPGLKSLHVIRRPYSRDPHPLHQTSRSDDTDPFSDDTCVKMSCGHAVSPENLYQYAWKKIQNGGVEVTCPAIPDANKPSEQCSKTWDFQSISKLACLSNDENNLFCSKLFSNVLEREANIYLCPVCNEAIFSSCKSVFKCFNCESSGASFSFCVRCNRTTYGDICYNSECQESLPKIRALLRDCRTRTLVDVPNCPSVRACPVCKCVIEYDEGESCKHMTCPRYSCQTKFCFICLKVKTDKYYWPCGGAYEPCTPSPRQII